MSAQRLFSVNDFAKISRTTRDKLHRYDSLGLLTPMLRGKNNYRYYSTRQLATVNFISMLHESGMTLEEIKVLKDRRTPENTSALFIGQMEIIEQKVNKLLHTWKLLRTMQKTIDSVLNAEEQSITIQSLPDEPIILGEPNDYSADRSDYDALHNFYDSMDGKFIDLNYPVWGLFSAERIKRGQWAWPDCYYFYNPGGHDKRPAALYAVGYTRGGYGQTDQLFTRMMNYIEQNGYEVCGNAYEEYPLNEICIFDDTNYLIRVMITVRQRHG